MNLIYLREKSGINKGINALTEVFIGEYPYYSTWIQKKQIEFENYEKEVIAITVSDNIVGYAMIHHSSQEYFKINGIYVFPQFEGNGYASRCIQKMIVDAQQLGVKYALIQTRFHNTSVTHIFDKLNFEILGNNYHEIEQSNNWLAICDIQANGNRNEMLSIVQNEYPGFIEMDNQQIELTRDSYELEQKIKTLNKNNRK